MREELRERVLSYMKEKKMVEEKGAAVLGVSGGADSVCLLLLLLELKERLSMEYLVVHVEHGIRGEASRRDAAFVRELCRKHGVACVVRAADVPGEAKRLGLSLEEAARNIRYDLLEREAETLERRVGKKCCIAVAHNANDNAETMLYHLARGTGLRGLTGIPPVRGRVIRPLLTAGREEIEEYLKEAGQSYCLDETNRDERYRRNRIRHSVLPVLEEINPAAVEHMGRTARLLGQVEEYLSQQAKDALDEAVSEKGLEKKKVQTLPGVLKNEVLRLWLERMPGGSRDVGAGHIEALAELLEAPVGKELSLPGKRRIVSGYDCLTLARPEAEGFPEISCLPLPGESKQWIREAGGKIFRFHLFPTEKTMEIPRKSYTKWFDYDKIKNNLVLRNRREGDFLIIDDQGRKKLLRRCLMDAKVPRERRDALTLLCSGSHVLWAPGLRISEAYKVSGATDKILEVQIMEEEEDE